MNTKISQLQLSVTLSDLLIPNNMRMIHHNREYSSSQVTGQKNVDFYLIVLDSTR